MIRSVLVCVTAGIDRLKRSRFHAGPALVLLAFALLLSPFAAVGASDTAKDYTLEPGDVVSVRVFQEPDLDRELRVSQEGDLSFPLIGRVEAKGRTIAAVEQTVREAYDRDFLVNPQINIVVIKYQIRTVNVLGAVNQPQAVEYPPEQRLTILDAISRAGGFNRLADRRRVRLTRTLPDGRTENSTVNTDELMAGSKDPLILQKDDVIFVPERVL
ncbi:MAG TPA: polysaccharide biosynthesis/export family protein [Opitutaceae bacterium]|nr:polysaccharide biosynthesis/export family protein [Opitutaceae bacterium]